MRILVVEDDAPLASFVRKGLEAEHYAVDVAGDGELARQMALESDYDLVVLDLNLPKLDGIGVLNSVRPKKPSLPVLVLTARSRIEDRVQSLDTGADDCLTKPFSFTELSARVRALLRRGPRTVEAVLRVADLELDRVARKVERGGKRIELTSKEFALLEYLMRNAGRRVTRAMIVEHVWNLSFDTSTNIVDVLNIAFPSIVSSALMRRLRSELVYQRARGPAVSQESIGKRLLDSAAEMELATPAIPVRLMELLTMQTGSVLPLRRHIEEPAMLRLRGRDCWLARPVSSRNCRAAQLLQSIPQPEAEE
jgi:DNA-binding response OmpR family regulator